MAGDQQAPRKDAAAFFARQPGIGLPLALVVELLGDPRFAFDPRLEFLDPILVTRCMDRGDRVVGDQTDRAQDDHHGRGNRDAKGDLLRV